VSFARTAKPARHSSKALTRRKGAKPKRRR
jgi:hypothetical protein